MRVGTSLLGTAVHAVVTADGGPPGSAGLSRQAAQRLARSELSKQIYHQRSSLAERVLRIIDRWLATLYHTASGVPGGWWGTVALAALAVIITGIVLAWIGPVATVRRRSRAQASASQAPGAREHRENALALAQAGDYTRAICESVRAIAAELDERGVLAPSTGRTADEFAAEAGQFLPGQAQALREAVTLFDEICYGQRVGTLAGWDRLHGLDAHIQALAIGPGRPDPPQPALAAQGPVS